MTTVNYALTTRQKVKDFLGISDTSKDTIIDQLINGVSDYIERYCGGRRFKRDTYTEVKDPKGKTVLFLNQYPVVSVASVEYRGGTPTNPTWHIYNADSYITYEKEGYLKFFGNLTTYPQGMRVNYTAGYLIDFTDEFDITAHTLPFDITKVATELVAKQSQLATSQGIQSQTTEGQSISFNEMANAMSNEHKTILNSYKNYQV